LFVTKKTVTAQGQQKKKTLIIFQKVTKN